MNIGNIDKQFIEDIINGMHDWVRVIDRNNNIIYLNKSMSEALNCRKPWDKCFEALGRTVPCDECVSNKTIFDGNIHEKEEIIGGRIFSVMSSPVKDRNGNIVAVVEVLRDITAMKQLQEEMMRQNMRMQADLEFAKKLQQSLLPKIVPGSQLNFSFLYKPCEALGGDFLDIFEVDGTHTGIYIADVSGHGVPASMMTIFLRSTINSRLLSPAAALEELHRKFNNSKFDQDFYITVFYAIIDTENLTMTFSNAGHSVRPFIYSDNRFEILKSSGTPIGTWTDKPSYADSHVSLLHGDRLFFYTDGIVEMKNAKGERFGEERLVNILTSCPLRLDEALDRVLHAAYDFAGIRDDSQLSDDITMALLEIK